LAVPLAPAEGDTSLLTHDAELALIRKMLRLPEVVEAAAISLAPHSLPYYAMELATSLHAFYDTDECRVLPRDPANASPSELALSRARLKLVAACQIALANTLALIGVRTPEQMGEDPKILRVSLWLTRSIRVLLGPRRARTWGATVPREILPRYASVGYNDAGTTRTSAAS